MAEETTNGTPEGTDEARQRDGGGQQPGEGQRTFTQQELEAILADRLSREREKFADYAELKEAASQWREHQEAQKTELERMQGQLADLQAERDRAQQMANDRLIEAALVAEANRRGFANVEDAIALADYSAITITDDGRVEGAGEVVKSLADSRPYLIGKRQAPGLDAGAGGGERATETVRLTAEEIETARKMRISPEAYAKQKAKIKAREG